MSKKIIIKASYLCYIFGIVFIFLGIWYIAFNTNNKKLIKIENANLEKTISTAEFIDKKATMNSKDLKPVFYDNVYEAIENAKYFSTSFKGKLTHYGPDCAACGGTLGCNRQNALNGNIYYNDKEYGTLRIVASTKLIPCGSIIRINVDAYDKNGMYVIVLDRGVSPGIIDLLKESETSVSPVRTVNNVTFDIVRYGY